MKSYLRNFLKLAALLLLVAGLGFTGLTQAQAAGLPPSNACTGTGTVTCNLWAKTGSFTFPAPDGAKPIWGYTDSAGSTLAVPGGPALVVNQGDVVSVVLHNGLSEATALLFQGQDMRPDLSGAAAGGTKTYTFTASQAGTFLYEAGLIANAQHQVAMGLYGALIVRPATPGQAYANSASAFNEEALLVLSEFDVSLSANPAAFDMRNYHPQYFLINGKMYPNTDAIPVTAGNKVLLRYVNAGLQAHAMSGLGFSQSVVGQDGSPYAYPRPMVAETIATGQTLDAIVSISATTPGGSQLPLYDANLMLHNGRAAGLGGMLTSLNVGTGSTGSDTQGPLTSQVSASPNPSNGSANVSLSANISDAATGNANVTAAEYFIDAVGANGAGTAMSGSFGSPSVSVNATLSTAQLAALSSGAHTLYVHGRDALNNWGAVASVALNLDKTGPTTSALSLSANPSNGTADITLTANASDTASGGSNITAAEYFIDPTGSPAAGSGTPMTVNAPAPTASLSATLLASTVNALSAGSHTLAMRSQDALGNWGALVTITLNVDKTGPATSGVSATPSANNGALPFNTTNQSVRVAASFSDTASGGSNVAAAEGFIDTLGAAGTGFVFIATDGAFNSPSEAGYSDVPLAVINTLSTGTHTIYARAKDAAGNWGAAATLTFLIDKTAPTFTGISLSPNPTLGATTVTLSLSGAVDPLVGGLASGVAGGEYWIGTTVPAAGSGTAFSGLAASIPTGSLANGTYTVGARIRDAAGNWSANTASATLTVVPNAIFSDGFESGNFRAWSSVSTNTASRLSVTAGSALVGTRGMQAQGNNTNYAQFNFGTAANPASATYDARFYFRPNGNTSTGKDVFSAATSSGFGTVVFRVRYRLSGTTPQVQIQLGNTANSTWTSINGGTSNNVIEVVWQAAGSGGPNPGTLTLYVNGVSAQTLTTTSTSSIAAVRLGSVTSTGSSTALYFDAFSSKRGVSPLIGP
jgi:hypothetical protein